MAEDRIEQFRQIGGEFNDPDNKIGRYILDANGEPVPEPNLFSWGRWLEDSRNDNRRVVAQTDIDSFLVSTVFLALDHNLAARAGIPGADPRPVLWETMVFNDYGAVDSRGFTQRYRSRADAVAGHARVIEEVKAWLAAGMPKEENDDC